MGSIYGSAKSVIAWLGEGDDFSDSALAVMIVINRVPMEKYKKVALYRPHELDAYKILGMLPVPINL
jgi:hypothetical protein